MLVFSVKGLGMFPYDMLRYDCCWPCESQDVIAMESRKHRVVSLASKNYPTVKRWENFGWVVLGSLSVKR